MSWFVTSHTQTIRKSSNNTRSSGAVMPFAACFSTRDILSTSYPTATLTLFLAAATTSFLTITGILSVLPSFSPKRQKPSESYQPFANQAERKRIECLGSRRKGNTCRPRRSRPDDCMDKSFAVADFAALIGNRQTLQTYPKEWRRQLTLVTTNTLNPPLIKTAEQICRSGNGFLWHFGHGAVHKGLDLVLEAFASMPLCRLHITAGLNNEPDFLKLYHRELFELPNITCHGFMDCQSAEFRSLLEQCFCFIAPSCAEGISPACAMLMKSGLYPVLSNNCGIDLPPGCGTILKNCTVSEIKQTVEKLAQTPHTKLLPQIQTCQQTALRLYSQDRFKQQLSDFIDKIISQNNRLTKEQI